MKSKNLKQAIKKVKTNHNKSKEEISYDIKRAEKVAHLKEIIKDTFPIIEKVDNIYDGQTVVNALSGFILAHLENKLKDIKLSECEIMTYLEKEEEGKIKTALIELMEKFKDEPAKELSEALQKLGDTFTNFGADKFLRNPMSEIKITDIIA